MPIFNRRDLAKGLASGIAVGLLPSSNVEGQDARVPAGFSSMVWREVFPGIWKSTLGTPEAHTPVASRLTTPAMKGFQLLPRLSAPMIEPVSGQVTNRGCTLRLQLKPNEQVYGFGLQLLSFAQRGRKKTIRVNADPRQDTGDSHAPVPLYISSLGYAVLVDSSRHVDFYCGEAHPKPLQPQSRAAGVVNTPEETERLALAESGLVTVEVPRAAGVEVYLFGGPSMLEAVQRYNIFSGGGVIPPAWGLGFWYRGEAHGTHDSLTALAREFRERKIPCDVLGLEPGWQTHAYSCSFVWDEARFPDPKAFVSGLSAMDFKVNLWEHAFTHPTSPVFEELLPYSGDYGVWGGLVPDFEGKPARKIFGDYHGRTFIDAGISGFKIDECDSSDYTGGWSFPDMSRFPSGVDGEQMHGIFGLRYQHTVWQQFVDRNQPTYNLVRSSGALAAPYPFVLYSDLYDHRQFVRGLVNAGFSGLLWCPEVRDASSEEDLIRRLQTTVFSPLAMINAWYIKNPPWKQIDRDENNADRLAADWQKLEARCREIIGWRMQLVPYLLSAFDQYALDGRPPFRALVLDYPAEPSLAKVDDQYMMGDRMLVAPLFAGETERKIILPAGRWHDFWTGKIINGNATLSVTSQTEKIPVFVKSGSVLPVAAISASTASPDSKSLTVRVYGDGSLPWSLGDRLTLTWDAAARRGHAKHHGSPKGSTKDEFNVLRWDQVG